MRVIGNVNCSPEHVQTHLSYNGKPLHRKKKRRKKGDWQRKRKGKAGRERTKH